MSGHKYMDIYARMARNRLRLAMAIAVMTAVIMMFSGIAIYLLSEAFDISIAFWLSWTLFWLLCLLYIILRYAVGGMWILKGVKTLPAWRTDHRLEGALMEASLASGISERIRLFEIPDEDINSFSISLPDGTFALFVTAGVSHKLSPRERVAVMAHEIAHMQAGDTTIYTIMLRLAGRHSLKKMVGGIPGGNTRSPFGVLGTSVLVILIALASLFLVLGAARSAFGGVTSGVDFWASLALLFLALILLLPTAFNALLRFTMDKRREFHADLQAVYLTRDPESVWNAVKMAAEDVRDVILLPACFDALLFHPVIDFSSYRPYRTQPTMAQRMECIREAFPIITA